MKIETFRATESKSETQNPNNKFHQSRDSENSIYFALFASSNIAHFDTHSLLSICFGIPHSRTCA